MTKDDFKHIRWSLLLALLMVALGAAALLLTHRVALEQRKAAQQAQTRLDEARSRLARARDEEAEIKSKIGRFDDLLAAGVIGTEKRLEWVEQIKAIKSVRRLYDLQYEIAPQRPLDAAIAPGSSGSYAFLSSTMRLQMQLLHEVDLMQFLDDLRGSAHVYLRPERCSVERTGRDGRPASGPQLKADCVLDWITIREQKAGA